MPQTASSVSQYGITWEFDGTYTVGQYANGDWWVEGPVTITKITPESTEVDGRVMHGTMVNPVGGTQGFDSYDSDMGYDPELNVDPGAAGNALVVEAGSVVSSISLDSPDSSGRPVLSDLAILTVVTAQPPADAFRPGPYSDDTAAQWTESDLDYGVLRSLPMLDSAPDLDSVTESVERFWNEQDTTWKQRTVHAKNNQAIYGREIAYELGDALLSLHLDYSEEQKRDLFVNMVQRGLDIYDRASVGGVWEDNCGHNPGRKMPMLFAGLALDDDAIVEMARAERPRENFRFQEDRQTFIVSEADIENPAHTDEQRGEGAGETDTNGDASGTLAKMPVDPETLPPIVPGTVEFEVGEFPDGDDDTVLETITDDGDGNLTGSESATGTIDYENGSWEITGSVPGESLQVGYEYSVTYKEADLGTPEWGCQYTRDYGNSANSLWGASYRWIGSSFMHHGLTAHVMEGAVDAWNHPPFFEYLDRYVENGSPSSNSKNGIQPFAEEFWTEYRTSTGPVTVTASGETIPVDGTASLSIDAQSVDTVTVENLWTDWDVQSPDPAGATTTDDRVGQTGEFELQWDSVQGSVAPSLTIAPPGETYVGGTYAVEVVAERDGDSATGTARIEISDSSEFVFSAESGITADGTFADGSKITIQDDQQRFGTKSTQAPHMFDRQSDGQLVNGTPEDAYADVEDGDSVPVGDAYAFEDKKGDPQLGDPLGKSPPSPGRSGWYYAKPYETESKDNVLTKVVGWPDHEDEAPPKPRRQVYVSWLIRTNWNLYSGEPYDIDDPGGSAKVHRIWADDYKGEGYRFSWTRMHATLTRVGDDPGDNVEPYPSWNETSWNEFERWHRLEIEIDYRDGGYTRCYVDGELIHDISILETNPDWVGSISPRLWGYNPTGNPDVRGWERPGMVMELADYYVDSSLARVVLTNAESWEQSDRRVTQPHFSWADGELEFELYEGVLADKETVYLWAVDETGDPTSIGTLDRETTSAGSLDGGEPR